MFARIGITILLWLILCPVTYAQKLTDDLEIKLIPSVGAGWQTVNLENTYTDAIVVCTYNLPSTSAPPAVTRIMNVTATSFDLRIQQFEDSSIVTASDVHCVIADEGAHNSGGLKYEARKVISDGTSGLAVGWGVTTTENVTADITQTYANPHVVGQVMSFNDSKASAFWNFDCENRGNGAFFSGQADGICIGKHIGQINGTRVNETLGYIVVEAGTGTVNDISFAAAVGPDTGAGVGNSPPYNYSVTGDFDIGILTDAGEDGGQGGWAILYGADPLPANQIRWAIDEEIVAGDTTRTHTSENVGYWIFENNQSPDLDSTKSVQISSESTSPYSIPGSDFIYTITTSNTGSGPVDANSILIIDTLPDEVMFYNGDIDGPGPETDAVILTDNTSNSGLTLNFPADVRYSSAATVPTSFAACSPLPVSNGYDPNIKHICIQPAGSLSEGVITPSSFSLQFRVRVE